MVSTYKESKMKFLQWIKSLFTERSYQDSVETFVVSKQPKSTAEVEMWVRYYDQNLRDRSFVWSYHKLFGRLYMKFLKISEEQELAEHKECGIKMALGEKIAS